MGNGDNNETRKKIAQVLAPWQSILSRSYVCFDTVRSSDGAPTAVRVWLILHLHLCLGPVSMHNNPPVHELLDLLRLVVILDPLALHQPSTITTTCIDRDNSVNLLVQQPDIPRCFCLEPTFSDAKNPQRLMTDFVDGILAPTRHSDHSVINTGYLDAKAWLLKMIGANNYNDRLDQPVRIKMIVFLLGNENLTSLDSADFFVHLRLFALRCRGLAEDQPTAPHNTSIRFKLDEIMLHLNSVSITHRVVKAVKSLVNAGTPITCDNLALDPRLISCSCDDLIQFVRLVSKNSTAFDVKLGDVREDSWEGETGYIDVNGEDRKEIIRDMFQATAAAPALNRVDITPLVMQLTSTMNIRAMFYELMHTLLGAENPPMMLICRPSYHINYGEFEYLRDIAKAWRQEHPDRRIRLEGVEFCFRSGKEPPMMFLELVDEVQHIAIRTYEKMSDTTLWTILGKFPQVKILKLVNIEVETMNDITLFVDSRLEELVLVDMTLFDDSSFIKLIHVLGDESTNLAKNLRRLEVCRRDHRNEMYALDEGAARALLEMLAKNRVLANISVALADEPEVMREIRDDLIEQNDMILVKGKLSKEEDNRLRARRLAFLSAVRDGDSACGQLDAVVVGNIFEFTKSFEYRHIKASFENPVDDMDDDLVSLADSLN